MNAKQLLATAALALVTPCPVDAQTQSQNEEQKALRAEIANKLIDAKGTVDVGWAYIWDNNHVTLFTAPGARTTCTEKQCISSVYRLYPIALESAVIPLRLVNGTLHWSEETATYSYADNPDFDSVLATGILLKVQASWVYRNRASEREIRLSSRINKENQLELHQDSSWTHRAFTFDKDGRLINFSYVGRTGLHLYSLKERIPFRGSMRDWFLFRFAHDVVGHTKNRENIMAVDMTGYLRCLSEIDQQTITDDELYGLSEALARAAYGKDDVARLIATSPELVHITDRLEQCQMTSR